MYYNHNLRTNLQEWKNRLSRASWEQFGHQLKYLLQNIEGNKLIKGLIHEAIIEYPYDKTKIGEVVDDLRDIQFKNQTDHASFCYQLMHFLIESVGHYDFHQLTIFQSGSFEENKEEVISQTITPIFYYLHDKLDKSNSTIYLLEKYKRRTEWFTKLDLLSRYQSATKSYEQILEDDLRMFLFDQGIDYPFSTPKSTSGRADIIGAIDTSDPIVLEIKIVDKKRGYGKGRIKEGFTQILKYANDYNKDIGYLVIYNLDSSEINCNFSEQNDVFPPVFNFNNKTFFFIVINLAQLESASNLGTLQSIEITEADLLNNI